MCSFHFSSVSFVCNVGGIKCPATAKLPHVSLCACFGRTILPALSSTLAKELHIPSFSVGVSFVHMEPRSYYELQAAMFSTKVGTVWHKSSDYPWSRAESVSEQWSISELPVEAGTGTWHMDLGQVCGCWVALSAMPIRLDDFKTIPTPNDRDFRCRFLWTH